MNLIDRFLNNVTMYRLVLYALGILSVLAFMFSALGYMSVSIPAMAISLVLLLGVTYGTDLFLSRALNRVSFNPESSLITALILFLIIAPPASFVEGLWIVGAALIAIVSKYILSFKGKHLFNPAAVAALALTVLGAGTITWWVATPPLFPALLVLGLFIIRKLRRFDLWFAFLGVALVTKLIVAASTGADLGLRSWLVSWPTIFFSTIMLTEPLTMPATKRMRLAYAALVGILFSVSFSIGGLYSTPQLALIIGNLFTFFVSPKGRIRLKLVGGERLSDSIVEFAFRPNRPLSFVAGQYAEWTLPHESPDDRGVRRYFTFASAPSDRYVRLAVRVGRDMSSFKKALTELPPNGIMSISNVAGDFTLPADPDQKLLFVAGGVGITPFMSMVRELQLESDTRDIVLVYLANSLDDFAYVDELRAAQESGVRVIYIPTTAPASWEGISGALSKRDLHRFIPDSNERLAYISGPNGMVAHYKSLLSGIVEGIKTDYFPGL